MISTTILLARHGETADNARLVFQGQTGKGLNARGRAQAQRLAERMATDAKLAHTLYASDLERAVETATIVSRLSSREVSLDPDLREVDVGLWSQKSHEEIERLYPDEWDAWSAGLDIRRGGGETYTELADRVDRAIRRIVEKHAGGRILLVSHGGAIKSWIAKILGVSAEGLAALAGVGNTSLTEVEILASSKIRLHGWNDRAHLEGLVVKETTD